MTKSGFEFVRTEGGQRGTLLLQGKPYKQPTRSLDATATLLMQAVLDEHMHPDEASALFEQAEIVFTAIIKDRKILFTSCLCGQCGGMFLVVQSGDIIVFDGLLVATDAKQAQNVAFSLESRGLIDSREVGWLYDEITEVFTHIERAKAQHTGTPQSAHTMV